MKSILKIVNSNDQGGVFTSETQYIRIFKEKGYRVELIILGVKTPHSEVYESLCDDFSYYNVVLEDFSGSWPNRLLNLLRLAKKSQAIFKIYCNISQSKFSAIIFRRANYLFLAGKLASHFKCKVYWHMPNAIKSVINRKLYQFFHKYYHIIPIANSSYTLNSYKTYCKDVIYPGFDPERVAGGTSFYKSNLGIPADEKVYGCIARVCYDKAQDILIEAFKKSETYNSTHLIIAGSLDSDEFRKKIIDLIGDSDRIHLIGNIYDVNEFYSSIDILVNSRRNNEAFGISIVEAMATSKPVLAYKLGGPSEIIDHGETGWLIEEPTVESYINGINLSYENVNNWKNIGINAKNRSHVFSAQYNVSKFIDLIEAS